MPHGTVERLELAPEPGARIVADRLPGRDPAIVYLHGLTSTRIGDNSEALFDRAEAIGRAAWRFDLRGHGDSSGELATTTLTDLIADARTVLERSGPAYLLGSSLGGLVAAWTAARHRELVLGLTLLAPAFRFLPRLLDRLDEHGDLVLPRGDESIHFERRVLDDLAEYDEHEMAAAITVPTLIVHGALDDTVPVSASEEVFASIPAGAKELVVLEHGDHALHDEFDEILATSVRFHRLDERQTT